MRILFIGAVEFSSQALKKLNGMKAGVVGVITKERSDFNADFCDLSGLCRKNNIPYKYVGDINAAENVQWIKALKPDVIFCFGWSDLLRPEILRSAPKGVIGYHPARLPHNRGRHPLIWALALGLKETASTFFFMDEGADSGDILSQKKIAITAKDNARSLYDKMTRTALKQIEDFVPRLERNTFVRVPQNAKQANYWRKRSKKDGEIDFRMTSRAVYNLVRALTRPYAGAHVVYKDNEVKIWEAKEVAGKLPDLSNVESGRVLKAGKNGILVKCYDAPLLLCGHEFKSLPKAGEFLK